MAVLTKFSEYLSKIGYDIQLEPKVGNVRIDLPGGNPEQMYDSLFGKIMKLPDKLEIYPGHDYGDKAYSTLEYEKENNYTLEPRTLEEFIEFMRTP